MQTEKLTISKEILMYIFFRREKKSFFNNLDAKKIVGNKRFWQTSFQKKTELKTKLHLLRKKLKIISDSNLVAETFN